MTTENNRPITVGSIVILQNSVDGGGYLDTYGWVANSPEFWNVAGTERIFVSTYAEQDRGGGTTSWQIVAADGTRKDGDPLRVGDRIHLRNMYSDAGYLDCCGWVEDLGPFRDKEFAQGQGAERKVRCGVFTSGAPNRDNGTGIWEVQGVHKTSGTLSEGDTVYLKNCYPANNTPVDTAHAETGWLVAYENVSTIAAFSTFQERQLLVFTSTNTTTRDQSGKWTMMLSPMYSQSSPSFRPEILKGPSWWMQSVTRLTRVLLRNAVQAISGIDIETSNQPEQQENGSTLLSRLLNAKTQQEKNAPDIIDYDFQVKQLWNILALSTVLQAFDQDTLQVLMQHVSQTEQEPSTVSPVDLVRNIFHSIAMDHEIIQRATMQRMWEKSGEHYSQSSLAGQLVIVDKLAVKAVTPFRHLLPNSAEQLAVITYFSEDTHIHHLPYTDQYILVGVNYDRISPNNAPKGDTSLTEEEFASFELMAIPHEVGHYLYRHGTLDGKTFPQISLKFKNNPYYRWCEELFADVYGCIVAGPLCAYSLQALLTSADRKRAWKDTDAHPTPNLRPFILSEILRVLSEPTFGTDAAQLPAGWATNYSFSEVAKELDTDWANALEKQKYGRIDSGEGRPTRMYVQHPSSWQVDRIINVDTVIANVRGIIKTYVRLLCTSLAQANAAADIPWKSKANVGAPSVNETARKTYAREMALLTGPATAREDVRPAVLSDSIPTIKAALQSDADKASELLEEFLDTWGDNGPIGIGGH